MTFTGFQPIVVLMGLNAKFVMGWGVSAKALEFLSESLKIREKI